MALVSFSVSPLPYSAVVFVVSVALSLWAEHQSGFTDSASDPFARANLEAVVDWPLIAYLPSLLALVLLVAFQLIYHRQPIKALNILFLGQGSGWLALFFFVRV